MRRARQVVRIGQWLSAKPDRPSAVLEHVQLDLPAFFRMVPGCIECRHLRALQAARNAGCHLFAGYRDGPRPSVGTTPYDSQVAPVRPRYGMPRVLGCCCHVVFRR